MSCARMPGGVREGLLGDAIGTGAHRVGQVVQASSAADGQLDPRELGGASQLLQVLDRRRGRRRVHVSRLAQDPEDLTRVVEGPVAQSPDRAQGPGRRPAVVDVECAGPRLQGDGAEVMPDGVVHISGDPHALGDSSGVQLRLPQPADLVGQLALATQGVTDQWGKGAYADCAQQPETLRLSGEKTATEPQTAAAPTTHSATLVRRSVCRSVEPVSTHTARAPTVKPGPRPVPRARPVLYRRDVAVDELRRGTRTLASANQHHLAVLPLAQLGCRARDAPGLHRGQVIPARLRLRRPTYATAGAAASPQPMKAERCCRPESRCSMTSATGGPSVSASVRSSASRRRSSISGSQLRTSSTLGLAQRFDTGVTRRLTELAALAWLAELAVLAAGRHPTAMRPASNRLSGSRSAASGGPVTGWVSVVSMSPVTAATTSSPAACGSATPSSASSRAATST